MNTNNSNRTPDFSSDEEAATFFDTHDTSDLEGNDVEWSPAPEAMVSYSVRFNRAMIGELRAVAAQRGIGVTQLMREWIEQRLAEEKSRSGQDRVAALTAHLRAALDDAEQLSRHRPAS